MDASLLRYLGQKSLGGLSALGNFLDVPGSMARDVLAGQNPFDQLLSPFSDAGRTTGRGLLEKYGMLGQNQSGFDWGDVAGVGAEILTDPTNWVTLGGKTALGQLAQKSGKLSKGLAPAIKAGERAAMTFHLPLMNETLGHVGTGALAQKVAGKVDKYANALRYSGTGRFLAKHLGAENLGRSTKEGQQLAQDLFGDLEEARQKSMLKTIERAQKLTESGLSDSRSMSDLRRLVEGVAPLADPSGVGKELSQEAIDYAGIMKDYGFTDKELQDLILYSHRRALANPTSARAGSAPLNMNNPKVMSRYDILRGFREGTEGVNQLGMDADVGSLISANRAAKTPRKKAIKDLESLIESKYSQVIEPEYTVYGKVDKHGNPLKRSRYRGLATYLYNRWTPEMQKQGIFGNILADAHGYAQNVEMKKAVADKLYGWLGANAKTAAGDATKEMSIKEFIKRGSNGLILAKEDPTTGKIYGALPKIMEMSGFAPPKDVKEALSFGERVVDRRVGEDLTNIWEATKVPKDLGALGKTAQSATSLFKAGVLTHPARYVRDLFGATFRNLEEGAISPTSFKEGAALAVGKNPESLTKHPMVLQYLSSQGITNPTPKQAGDAARALVASYLPGGHIGSEAGDTAQAVDPTLRSILGLLPGHGYEGAKSVAKDIGSALAGVKEGTTWNPLKAKVKGVLGAEETTFAPLKAGELAGDVTDKMGRIPAFLELTKQGWDPMAAARKVGDMQTVYASQYYTPTEKQWLKNLFPFYSFQKNQLGYTLRDLLESQGGSRLGNVIKATSRSSSEDPYVPDHIRQASSIRLGDKPGDVRSYLTSFGLMHEDPAAWLGTMATNDLRGGLLEAMSNMNPLLKWIPEWAMGRTAFQRGPNGGRDLEDLDPTIGRIIANVSDSITGERTRKPDPFLSKEMEFVLANMPTSRWMTTLRTLTDPRKAWWEKLLNTTTGARISDVSPGAMDRVKSDYVDALMSDMGATKFTNLGFTDAQEQAMDPDTLLKARLLESIKAKIAKDQKERAKR